mmetsp:Transcript_94709/g.203381  ORF Transcript_94709/g.203381 Transcript_94709/m.203381 type:complete len:269 (-) Transcript_94709:133-939(-)
MLEEAAAQPMDLSVSDESDLEVTSDEDEEEMEEQVEGAAEQDAAAEKEMAVVGDLEVRGEKTFPAFLPGETIIVLDWDDTLLPSTWIAREGLRLDGTVVPSPAQEAQLRRLARSVARTLRGAKRCGRVVLVTNAERGWIELSCHRFMPSLCPLLENINTISARSLYERVGVTSPLEWKSRAFASIIDDFYKPCAADHRKNVISLGDSAHERWALMQVTKTLSNCSNKSLKFIEQPDLRQLRKEHELISRCIPYIVSHAGNLDLRVQLS